MTTTLQLLKAAEDAFKGPTRQLSIKLGLSPTTLTSAKLRGHLSPTLACLLANSLGEDEIYWTAIAGLESEKRSKQRDAMLKAATKWKPETQKGSHLGAPAIGGEGRLRSKRRRIKFRKSGQRPRRVRVFF